MFGIADKWAFSRGFFSEPAYMAIHHRGVKILKEMLPAGIDSSSMIAALFESPSQLN